MKAHDFDNAFESGEDILEYLDTSSIRKPMQQLIRINEESPVLMLKKLAREASCMRINRQSRLPK